MKFLLAFACLVTLCLFAAGAEPAPEFRWVQVCDGNGHCRWVKTQYYDLAKDKVLPAGTAPLPKADGPSVAVPAQTCEPALAEASFADKARHAAQRIVYVATHPFGGRLRR